MFFHSFGLGNGYPCDVGRRGYRNVGSDRQGDGLTRCSHAESLILQHHYIVLELGHRHGGSRLFACDGDFGSTAVAGFICLHGYGDGDIIAGLSAFRLDTKPVCRCGCGPGLVGGEGETCGAAPVFYCQSRSGNILS